MSVRRFHSPCCTAAVNLNPSPLTTHRLQSSSLLWFIFLGSYKVTPKRNYLGAYGYYDFRSLGPRASALWSQRLRSLQAEGAAFVDMDKSCVSICLSICLYMCTHTCTHASVHPSTHTYIHTDRDSYSHKHRHIRGGRDRASWIGTWLKCLSSHKESLMRTKIHLDSALQLHPEACLFLCL